MNLPKLPLFSLESPEGSLAIFYQKRVLRKWAVPSADVGIGALIRKFGLTCDTLISFEMVNAKGELIQVTKDMNIKAFSVMSRRCGGNFDV